MANYPHKHKWVRVTALTRYCSVCGEGQLAEKTTSDATKPYYEWQGCVWRTIRPGSISFWNWLLYVLGF